ncbi:hypothetical protein A3C91_04045 [Candidatus Azambacteria bacterium RIFCSPHIGHO2_02_FULL_52_12]|uniref:Fibronectin type-III domain-containing protein n=1 Tax=Candidatus Azambacteria bacterium RIFCSPLOWO2_01_FULL_46_25 TaxID=1797298 RepID=A0A1F5BUZ4_9BACT|nr:MAG: hypothetical protein A3C91_04045 [Candidatus Azambacteria bacterium RIFCSPHIGHO2_02_FULL_52_12]OGD34391.1 MAG: hypothetical protein A2988_02590 [Candidatus Azambacteria bacterium RIFCSPLOWO2_01_FULL_46_25]OGD37331.1 MAG: hypothetical protein A2850_01300 [Candidatus Azambacteria bacterium RIFCSPHIGHO2_01_FULL_51_74]
MVFFAWCACAAVGAMFFYGAITHAQLEKDETPPRITSLKMGEIKENSAVITWKTNEQSDSLVNYGLDKNYGISRDPVLDKTTHEIVISGLDPSTIYHFRAISSDPTGNQAISSGYTFTTKGLKNIKGIEKVASAEQRAVTEKSYALLEKVTDQEALALIAEKLGDIAKDIASPPVIIGTPQISVGVDWAEISWVTDKKANSMVSLASQAEYDPGKDDPYAFTEGEETDLTVAHVVRIPNLKQATTYHFRVSSRGNIGEAGKSLDAVFTTKSILPEITGLSVKKVEDVSATMSWNTNVPTSALVEYTNIATREVRSEGVPTFLTSHIVQLKNLSFGARYSAVVKAENEAGEKIQSAPLFFTTIKDESPPIIFHVTNESTLYPGAETKIQTIISWDTDELALCQFSYRQGLASSGNDTEAQGKEIDFTTHHVQVVVEFAPSMVYKFWVECKDRSGNAARSEDFVLFTPEKEKSIIDIILENFEGTFGWVKQIGK